MHEDYVSTSSKTLSYVTSIKTFIFRILTELLKERCCSPTLACLLMLLTFFQLIGFLFNSNTNLPWNDGILLDIFTIICDYARVFPAVQQAILFWVFYYITVTEVVILFLLTVYMILRSNEGYSQWPVRLLRVQLIMLEWAIFIPALEFLISLYNCRAGYLLSDVSYQCYTGSHIFHLVLSSLCILLLVAMYVLTALFHNETNLFSEDAFSSVESNLGLWLLCFKCTVVVLVSFVHNVASNWTIILLYLAASSMLVYHYFSNLPYYNKSVSILWGSLVCNLCWISLNALLAMITNVYGHVLIIFTGVFLVAGIVCNMRTRRLDALTVQKIEECKSESDALLRVLHLQQIILTADTSNALIIPGLVNLHLIECQHSECMCRFTSPLFDPSTHQFQDSAMPKHLDLTFLKHFIKKMYEDVIAKFSTTLSLRIYFSLYLFQVLRNVNASLAVLEDLGTLKLSLKEELAVYRHKANIEQYLAEESMQGKAVYFHLTNVICFENLLEKCQKAVEEVCTAQIEFWGQVALHLPDLNILEILAKKIFEANVRAEKLWEELCKINSNYPKALQMYGNYLCDIRNNTQAGVELLEKMKMKTNKKSLEEWVKSPYILFAGDTAVIHISGKKENPGKVTKANEVVTRLFGYTKNEVIGNDISMLMPRIFAKRHGDFMRQYFQTGFQASFQEERILYGLHRSECCFAIKLYVKTMQSLEDGLEYVGMVRPHQEECEYIITDTKGTIDCFSAGVSSALKFPMALLRTLNPNVQILAPQLLNAFGETDTSHQKRDMTNKFKESGGHSLLLIVPKNFGKYAIAESQRKQSHSFLSTPKLTPVQRATEYPLYKTLNDELNQSKKGFSKKSITLRQLLSTREYSECDVQFTVKCEMKDCVYGSVEPLKLWVLKIFGLTNTGLNTKTPGSEIGSAEIQSSGSLVFNNYTKNRPKEVSKFNVADSLKSPRIETKTTERLPGHNILTTLENVATEIADIGPVKMHFAPDPRTGSIRPISKKTLSGRMSKEQSRSGESSIEHEKEDFSEAMKKVITGINSRRESSNGSNPEKRTSWVKAGTFKKEESGSEGGGVVSLPDKVEERKEKLLLRENEDYLSRNRLVPPPEVSEESPPYAIKFQRNYFKEPDTFGELYDSKELGSPKVLEDETVRHFTRRAPEKRKQSGKGRLKIVTNPIYDIEGEFQHVVVENQITEDEQRLRRELLDYEHKKHKNKNEDKEQKTTETPEPEAKKLTIKEVVENNDDDTQSSVNSSGSLDASRSFCTFRAAIEEKYIPASVQRMSCLANLVFLLLISLSVIYYIIQERLYQKIDANVKVIPIAEQRVGDLVNINMNLANMQIYSDKRFVEEVEKLKENVESLSRSQTLLQYELARYSKKSLEKINPQDVILKHKRAKGLPDTVHHSLSEAVLELIVASYKISLYNTINVKRFEQDASIHFLSNNSLSFVIPHLKTSADAFKKEADGRENSTAKLLLVFLCIASAALAASTALLIPVVNKAKKHKQEVLELFMYVKKPEANKELGKCRKFLGGLQPNSETEILQEDLINPDKLMGDDEDGSSGEVAISNLRKHKGLGLNIGFALLKFVFLILLMEGYYLLTYFLSTTFLACISSLSEELAQILSRIHSNSFILLLLKDYQFDINGAPASVSVIESFDQLYVEENRLLDLFTQNYDSHSDFYNSLFNRIILNNACEAVPEFRSQMKVCESFNQGILQKGVYSSAIKYGDYLRQIHNDYLSSYRDNKSRIHYLNSTSIHTADVMQGYYFKVSLNYLASILEETISASYSFCVENKDYRFRKERQQDMLLFIAYIGYIFFVYILFWRGFVAKVQEELWKTKTVLSVMPPDILMGIPEIRSFILQNSSMSFFSRRK